MRLAISDLAFAGFRYRDLLHVPRNLGLEFFYEFGKNKYWDSVLPQIRHGHAKALSIHGPCLSINLANPAQDNCYEKIFSKTFAYASKVKADFVVVHTNEELYGDPEQLRLDVWNKLVNLDQLAHDYDITLAVENVGLRPLDTLLFDLPEFEHLLEDLPRVAVLLDTGHAHVNSWDLPKVIEHFGSRLAAGVRRLKKMGAPDPPDPGICGHQQQKAGHPCAGTYQKVRLKLSGLTTVSK
ncbi:MAG: TIM barrel protein [Acidaminococcaceae bacterium]|jgi:sugar phosphate isomerase/epimerase|nr:TIM barrel protein [Acidaminococcaceae bacterium]